MTRKGSSESGGSVARMRKAASTEAPHSEGRQNADLIAVVVFFFCRVLEARDPCRPQAVTRRGPRPRRRTAARPDRARRGAGARYTLTRQATEIAAAGGRRWMSFGTAWTTWTWCAATSPASTSTRTGRATCHSWGKNRKKGTRGVPRISEVCDFLFTLLSFSWWGE